MGATILLRIDRSLSQVGKSDGQKSLHCLQLIGALTAALCYYKIFTFADINSAPSGADRVGCHCVIQRARKVTCQSYHAMGLVALTDSSTAENHNCSYQEVRIVR